MATAPVPILTVKQLMKFVSVSTGSNHSSRNKRGMVGHGYDSLPSPEFTSSHPSPRLVIRIIDLLCIKIIALAFSKCRMVMKMMFFVGMRLF